MIRVEDLTLRLPGFCLDSIHLQVPRGGFHALLGPTGSGKTLLLEALAGVVPVDRGAVRVNGRDVTRAAPEGRGIGIVYQDCGLFPHLDVWRNVTYGLKYRGRSRPSLFEWADWLMGRLNIAHLKKRFTLHLSGGEKQRVALARALAVRPGVLLLDEPLSALDPCFRWDMQRLIKGLHAQLALTCLLVTHDFSEAMYLAEEAAVIHQGRIRQCGKVRDIFTRPADPLVAEFVGMQNVFEARLEGTHARVGDARLELARDWGSREGTVAVRPEHVRLYGAGAPLPAVNAFPGRLLEMHDRGAYCEVLVKAGGREWVTALSRYEFLTLGLSAGDGVALHVPVDCIHVI